MRNATVGSLSSALFALAIVLSPAEAHGYCGGPTALITSLQQVSISESGSVKVSIGYDANTRDITWRWRGGAPVSEYFYQRQNVPNPYEINLDTACMTEPGQFEVTSHNCEHGGGGETKTLTVNPGDHTPKIINFKATDGTSNVFEVSFSWQILHANSRQLHLFTI